MILKILKEYIASKESSNGYRKVLCDVYDHYAKCNSLTWRRPRYQRDDRPPYVPTEEEIEILIANVGKKSAIALSILRDTGMRSIELHRSTLSWYDLTRGLMNVPTAKGGRGRTLELKPRTLAMLKEYGGKHEVR